MYVIRRVDHEADLHAALKVRRTVFINEQGISEADELDGHEADYTHFNAGVAIMGVPQGTAVGTMRATFVDDKTVKFQRVAVLWEHRREGIGARLMDEAEVWAYNKGGRKIVLDAQVTSIPFYLTLGFELKGDVFTDAGIDHQKMFKNL